MGCKFSKNNKVLPVVEPIRVKPATSPPSSPKTKKGLGKGRSGKKTPPVTRNAPTAANNAACPATNDAESPADDGYPSPQAESTQATEPLNLHPLAGKEQSVDYGPIHLVKEADACNQEVTPSSLRETPETLVIRKKCPHGSDPSSADSKDNGINSTVGENGEYAQVIIEKSSPEKQEIAMVPDTTTPDLTIQGVYIQAPFRPSQLGRLGVISGRRPSSARPSLPHLWQGQPRLSLQAQEEEKHDKVKLLSIVERPSSRGGMAFEINFSDNNGGNRKMPKALQVKVKNTNFTREELQAKLDAADQRRKAREEEKQEKIRSQLEHDRQVMNALEAFQKAQMAKAEAKLNKKMAANEKNREQHLHELKNQLKEKNDKMMAATEAKKVKPLNPPIVKEELSN